MGSPILVAGASRRAPLLLAALGALQLVALASCTTRGAGDWVNDVSDTPYVEGDVQPLTGAPPAADGEPAEPQAPPVVDGGAGEPVLIKEYGTGRPRPAPAPAKKGGSSSPAPEPSGALPDTSGVFRNTYYDFPREGSGQKTATLFDGACAPLASVTPDFHDAVCVQGSGRVGSGATVSFARRGCDCAAACPRTGEKICFDRLDPQRFPHGRGAMGRAITPMRTVAVDSAVIPLGTVIYVPELAGLPLPDGGRHDGCFVAEDRGIRVIGKQIDVFTGDPAETARLNALYPSNRGVHVRTGDARCQRLRV
jgi:3D (Asp-Asp-Asp) domain-containing protein